MQVVVLERRPRENGMVDVTLALGATRFTVSVTAALDASDMAEATYQRMADRIHEEAQGLLAIVQANRSV